MGGDSVWALLCSLAVTNSISIDFFSCPYADVSTQGVPNLYRSCQKDTGVPIRKSTDQRFHAPPRGLSQLGTSIIGSRAQPFTRRHSNAKRHYYTTNILLNCLYFFKDPDSFSLPALTNKPLKDSAYSGITFQFSVQRQSCTQPQPPTWANRRSQLFPINITRWVHQTSN
jgi:hypothetical protein